MNAADLQVIGADLLAKRHKLSADLIKAQAVVTRIQSTISSVDTVLRLFGAGAPMHQTVLPLHRRDHSKIMLTALRDSPRPLTSMELARIVITERKFSPDDDELVRAIARRVRASLNHFKKRGALTSSENSEGLLVWQIVAPPAALDGEQCNK